MQVQLPLIMDPAEERLKMKNLMIVIYIFI